MNLYFGNDIINCTMVLMLREFGLQKWEVADQQNLHEYAAINAIKAVVFDKLDSFGHEVNNFIQTTKPEILIGNSFSVDISIGYEQIAPTVYVLKSKMKRERQAQRKQKSSPVHRPKPKHYFI